MTEIGERHGTDSAPWALAARWAGEWLLRAQRLSPPTATGPAVLVGDATRDQLDPDALALRALELCSARIGLRAVTLPITGLAGLSDVIAAYQPKVVVIAGGEEVDDDVARWAYRVRAAAGALPVLLYRRHGRGDRATTRNAGARHLADSASIAAGQLLDIAEGTVADDDVEEPLELEDVSAPTPNRRRMSA
jgi:hypothetical protein